MKRMNNSTHIEGYVYEHKLEMKKSGPNSKNPGTEYISGILSIATDDEMLNVVQIHFTYVTAVTSKGKPNTTFNILQSIIEGKIGSVMEHGKENAGKVRIDSAIGLNEWYDKEGKLVSVRRNEGGFVHQTQELDESKNRSTFDVDMIITNARRVEANPERDTPEKVVVKGCVFDFRNSLLPVEFNVYEPYAPAKALDYFESLEASSKNPVFTHVRGVQVSRTIVRRTEEESAFGEAMVKETKTSQRDFVINWASPATYEWDSEDTLLATEFGEMIANREVHLADVKKRQDEYQASLNNAAAGGAKKVTTPAKGEYNF